MTEAAKARTRGRRRIVATMALYALAMGWWFWPSMTRREHAIQTR